MVARGRRADIFCPRAKRFFYGTMKAFIFVDVELLVRKHSRSEKEHPELSDPNLASVFDLLTFLCSDWDQFLGTIYAKLHTSDVVEKYSARTFPRHSVFSLNAS